MSETVLPRVLIVEDQLNWRRLYKIWLRNSCHFSFSLSRSEAMETIRNQYFDVIIMDLGLPDPDQGISVIRQILESGIQSKIIVVSAFTERELLLQVQGLGVYAVFQKDDRLETEIPIFVRKAFEMNTLERENANLRDQFREKIRRFQILGTSTAAENLRRNAQSISQADTPVLITGPTGAGKNYFAGLIHSLSKRVDKPFVGLNCANLPPQLVESELFGHTRGAYTGADRATIGKFRLADGGTILLDEIGDLPVGVQAKLLQAIEEKSFFPLGGHEKIEVDVRILASTNRNLSREIAQGRFREDLFYRLAGFVVRIPSLSERKEDIPLYFDQFVREVCNQEQMALPQIESPVYPFLQTLPWPGNLRQLKNCATNLLLFHPKKITRADVRKQFMPPEKSLLDHAVEKKFTLREMTALYVKALFEELPNKTELARILQIDQKTLRRYLKMEVEEK
ncbi:hypothetical protein B1H10_08245 [candidate division KSB1 bacterium 4484_188]|nr:MAG: hypothetical protein B1H10_08245 [candidate division KSB1 bacterium 4484_188]HFE63429.1 sigma-54-dependent Fis family transcriptional regulator [Caldithrix sp.]